MLMHDTDFMTLMQRPKQPGMWQTRFFSVDRGAQEVAGGGGSKAHAHSCKHVEVAGIS